MAYSYPHVQITTRALPRRVPTPVESTATTLFAPFTCSKGPENQLIDIDSIAELRYTFGDLDYTKPGQRQYLNMRQWILGGGRVKACRLVADDAEYASVGTGATIAGYDVRIQAKHKGISYNGLTVSITKNTNNLFSIKIISETKEVLEQRRNLTLDKLHMIPNTSEYIGEIELTANPKVLSEGDLIFADGSDGTDLLETAFDTTVDHTSESVPPDLKEKISKILENKLETPVDTFIDAGYNANTKKMFLELFSSEKSNELDKKVTRPDVYSYYTKYAIANVSKREQEIAITENLKEFVETDTANTYDLTNTALINHIIKTSLDDKEIFVTPLYFIARLLPYNDMIYGRQYPTAGQTRGVINGALWINELPTSFEKNENYTNSINYIEKDSHGVYIMTQLTGTSEDTALKFTNNARSLLKIKRDLMLIGRRYLHEFNDRITKTNLQNTLDSYMASWIQNRALEFADIHIYDYNDNPALANEEVMIAVELKFKHTIEVISFEITVE